eukprot:gene21451-28421_t
MLDLLKDKVWDLVATATSTGGPPKLLLPLGSVDSSAVLQAICRFPSRNVDGHHAFSKLPPAPSDAWQCVVELDGVACAEVLPPGKMNEECGRQREENMQTSRTERGANAGNKSANFMCRAGSKRSESFAPSTSTRPTSGQGMALPQRLAPGKQRNE